MALLKLNPKLKHRRERCQDSWQKFGALALRQRDAAADQLHCSFGQARCQPRNGNNPGNVAEKKIKGGRQMKLKCILGIHEWNGCKCSKCGKERDQEHDWSGCTCTKCYRTRDEWHEWTGDLQKCIRCGARPTFPLVQLEDAPSARQVIDKIAANSRCITGPSWSRLSGACKSEDELAMSDSPIDVSTILTSKDLNLAEKVGFDSNLLANAAQAFCFHSINHQVGQDTWRDDVSTIVGDDAIEKLCRVKSQLSSYILYKVATAKPITVSLSGCQGHYEYTFDFAGRVERARKELKKRGFGERDPLRIVANPS